jgi:hypothetical protein
MNAIPDNNANNELILNFFKSLTHVERLKIIGALAVDSLTMEEISARLGLPIRDVFNHLGNLTWLGILHCEEKTYSLDTHAVEAMARQALAGMRPQTKEESFTGDDYERKVLADFMTPDGKLRAFPAQFKKLLVILHYLADQCFEAGVRYPEKQVNAILARYNEDTASLRRYMVDNHMLAREKGEYWKLEPANP